ncbi:hypothetical protein H4R19_001544, partial [Coemansia spiralis]
YAAGRQPPTAQPQTGRVDRICGAARRRKPICGLYPLRLERQMVHAAGPAGGAGPAADALPLRLVHPDLAAQRQRI